jgi:hypothetical protein
MKRPVRALALVALCMVACVSACGSHDAASQRQAEVIWQRNMEIVDASVQFWRQQTGVAPYTMNELESAVEFFESLTGIRSDTMSYLGPIPDENLMAAANEWRAWHSQHAARLRYDDRDHRVVLSE